MSIGARLRGLAEDVPFVPDGRTLRQTQILTLDTDLGSLDLLVDPSGSPGWGPSERERLRWPLRVSRYESPPSKTCSR